MAASVTPTFNGSNWQDLTRLVIATKLKFIADAAVDEVDRKFTTDEAKCAALAASFTGPALDWVGQRYETTGGSLFNDYNQFVLDVRNAFGISDEGLSAQRRMELEALTWGTDLPVFFAEFDRLTVALNLTSHSTRIALVTNKLPQKVRALLAEQALNFENYETMRERLLVMWNLDPSRYHSITTPASTSRKRSKCGRCGKRGHQAADCRSKN